MLNKYPTVVVHTMAFINQELAQVSGRHVGWDLHHLTNPILTEDLHDLWRNRLELGYDDLDNLKNRKAEKWQRALTVKQICPRFAR